MSTLESVEYLQTRSKTPNPHHLAQKQAYASKNRRFQSLRNRVKNISCPSATPIESSQHLYNLLVPQGWEKMQPYRNEKLTPSPLDSSGLGED